jgi:hypothetical protein
MVRRALGCLIVATLVAGAHSAAARTVEAEHAIPRMLPSGWYVIGAQVASPRDDSVGFRYYARGLDDDSPALAVGSIGCDGGCDTLRGIRKPVRGPQGADGWLVRNGPYVWVSWPDPSGAQDLGDVVIARGLDDDAALAAARATRGRDPSLHVGKAGLPDGVRDRGVVALSTDALPYGAEHITLLSDPPAHTIDLYTYEADASSRAAQAFFAGEVPRMSHDFQDDLVASTTRGRVAVATGLASPKQLAALVRAVRPADEQAWNHLRERVRDVPSGVLLPGIDASTGYTVLEGSTNTARWAAAFKRDGDTVTAYTALVDVDVGTVVGGSALRPYDAAAVTTLAQAAQPRVGLVTGVVPAGTASVRYEGTGTPPIAVQPADVGPDSLSRYFVQLLPAFPTAIVALDANGVEIARTR